MLNLKYPTEENLDTLYDFVDDCFSQGNFRAIDELLFSIDIAECSSTMLLGVLVSTLPAKSKLNNRPVFVNDLRSLFQERFDDKEADELLQGLS